MSTTIAQNIEILCQEKGIDREIVIEAMKEAVRAAAKKQFKSGEEIQVDWNSSTGLEISAAKVVVEEVADAATELSINDAREMAGDEVEVGDQLLLPLPMEELGRIAAQTAKQILFQKVRDAERSNIYEQYIDKIGDLVNGFVKRFERGNIIVDLGNLEAIIPRSQQSRGEQWNQGERIRVVIHNVSKESKGPQVEVSRTSPELIRRLFEMEVPEIYDETVIIKSAVREPGERAKIAVSSNERDVDPVGACVGMKGSRVQAIIRELRGEKIDIIEWSDEPSVFAANALSPAKVNQVRITNIDTRQMEVIVNEDQLSLAIGKRGQNVRLATKLVGWNIDIRSEEELKREVTEQMGALIAAGGPVPLSAIEGVTAATTATLAEHGINDIDALAGTTVDDIVEYLDVSLDEAESILKAAQAVISARVANQEGAVADEELKTEVMDQHAVSVEANAEAGADEDAGEVAPSKEMTAAGYDEAADAGDAGATEMSEGELKLQGYGRDLRPDTITPEFDIASIEAAEIEAGDAEPPVEEDTAFAPRASFASEASAPETQTPSAEAQYFTEGPERPEGPQRPKGAAESMDEKKLGDASDDAAK